MLLNEFNPRPPWGGVNANGFWGFQELFRPPKCRWESSLRGRQAGLGGVSTSADFPKKMDSPAALADESASTKCCVDKGFGIDILGSRP